MNCLDTLIDLHVSCVDSGCMYVCLMHDMISEHHAIPLASTDQRPEGDAEAVSQVAGVHEAAGPEADSWSRRGLAVRGATADRGGLPASAAAPCCSTDLCTCHAVSASRRCSPKCARTTGLGTTATASSSSRTTCSGHRSGGCSTWPLGESNIDPLRCAL